MLHPGVKVFRRNPTERKLGNEGACRRWGRGGQFASEEWDLRVPSPDSGFLSQPRGSVKIISPQIIASSRVFQIRRYRAKG